MFSLEKDKVSLTYRPCDVVGPYDRPYVFRPRVVSAFRWEIFLWISLKRPEWVIYSEVCENVVFCNYFRFHTHNFLSYHIRRSISSDFSSGRILVDRKILLILYAFNPTISIKSFAIRFEIRSRVGIRFEWTNSTVRRRWKKADTSPLIQVDEKIFESIPKGAKFTLSFSRIWSFWKVKNDIFSWVGLCVFNQFVCVMLCTYNHLVHDRSKWFYFVYEI